MQLSNKEKRLLEACHNDEQAKADYEKDSLKVYHVDPASLSEIVPLDKPVARKEINESPEPKGLAANLPACVYWITDGTYVKIGYTTNLSQRLATLQTGNANKLEVVKVLPFSTAREAYHCEQSLHQRNSRFHIRGEWFNVV